VFAEFGHGTVARLIVAEVARGVARIGNWVVSIEKVTACLEVVSPNAAVRRAWVFDITVAGLWWVC
jgi:hypothetical protein